MPSITLSCRVSSSTEGGHINNNLGPATNMSQQQPYPALSQLAHVYEQQQQQHQHQQQQQQLQQQNKDLNKYASLKAVGEYLPDLLRRTRKPFFSLR